MGWNNNRTTDGPTRGACCMWSQRDRWGKKGTQNRQNEICLRGEFWNYIQTHPPAFWHFISNTHLGPVVKMNLTPDIFVGFSNSRPTKMTLIILFV